MERTIQREEIHVEPVLDRESILEVRRVSKQILVAPHVREYAIQLVMATQPDQSEAHEMSKRYIRYGSSPRGAQALVECGRVLAPDERPGASEHRRYSDHRALPCCAIA